MGPFRIPAAKGVNKQFFQRVWVDGMGGIENRGVLYDGAGQKRREHLQCLLVG